MCTESQAGGPHREHFSSRQANRLGAGIYSCSAISVLLISNKLLLEIIWRIVPRFSSNIFMRCLSGIFPVLTIINRRGSFFIRKDSKKSISLLITILSWQFLIFGYPLFCSFQESQGYEWSLALSHLGNQKELLEVGHLQ